MRSQEGYLLIIVALAIAMLGISFAVANRSFFLAASTDREQVTKDEIELIVEAIRGNSKIDTFGYRRYGQTAQLTVRVKYKGRSDGLS